MADSWDQPTNGAGGRTPSPGRNRERSRSPDRRPMQIDDRDNRGRGGGGGGQTSNQGNNLHVSGLSNRIEERDLEEAFSKYGRVIKAQVMRDPHTKDPRGFGFVNMETGEEAEAALAGLTGTELVGKIITVDKARRGRARTPTPGAYHGPPKREFESGGRGGDRYDSRGGGGGRDSYRRDDRRDDRYGGGGGGRDRYDDRRGGDRYDDRSYAAPMRDDRSRGYDRGGEDRGYDDRRRE